MGTLYERFLVLLKKWPVNPDRVNRDYGSYLRKLLEHKGVNDLIFEGKLNDNEKKMSSLYRLADNKYKNMYPHHVKFGATGFQVSTLKEILNDKFLEYYNEKKKFLNVLLRK